VLTRHPQAEQDLIDIYQHIWRDNPNAAEKLVRLINAKCELLARSPLIGRARPELRADLRSFPHGLSDPVSRHRRWAEIVRVVHAARNLDDPV